MPKQLLVRIRISVSRLNKKGQWVCKKGINLGPYSPDDELSLIYMAVQDAIAADLFPGGRARGVQKEAFDEPMIDFDKLDKGLSGPSLG